MRSDNSITQTFDAVMEEKGSAGALTVCQPILLPTISVRFS
jgi:hypothetical protein